jgi:hypothetical protein
MRRVRFYFCPFCRKAVWPGDRVRRTHMPTGLLRRAHEKCLLARFPDK